MDYNDENLPSEENLKKMAKAYSESLKEKGFVFIKLDDKSDTETLLLQESLKVLLALKSSYENLKRNPMFKELYQLSVNQVNIIENIVGKLDYIFTPPRNIQKNLSNALGLENLLNSYLIELINLDKIKTLLLERWHFFRKNFTLSEGTL